MARQSDLSSTNTSRIVSAAASTNATVAVAHNGTLKRIIGYNAASSARYFKAYDSASSPTVGTDTPVLTIYLPPATGFEIPIDRYFSDGICYALTTGSADNDTGALTAGDVLGLNVLFN